MKELPNSNFDIIRQYVTSEDNSIVLSKLQQQLFKRWNFYINLKLSGQFKSATIIKMMMKTFKVERTAVYNDMGNAEALFGYTATMNKRFRIGARINFIEEKIDEMYQLGDAETAAKLESTLQRYYADYPEVTQRQPPRIINFNITKNDLHIAGLPELDEALATLQKALPAV